MRAMSMIPMMPMMLMMLMLLMMLVMLAMARCGCWNLLPECWSAGVSAGDGDAAAAECAMAWLLAAQSGVRRTTRGRY